MSVTATSSLALARLEPFLLMAKAAKGAAAAKLAIDATSAPGCYVFSELLDMPAIRNLHDDRQYGSAYRLLELFAFGTLQDYQQAPAGTYPELNAVQMEKLRFLTLASLASKSRNLSYTHLIQHLGVDHDGNALASTSSRPLQVRLMRQLEDIIIDATYAGIVSARLDQARQRVEVESVIGRDVAGQAALQDLSKTLMEWQKSTNDMLTTLSNRIQSVRQGDAVKAAQRTENDAKMERILTMLASGQGEKGKSGGGGGSGSLSANAPLYDRLGSDRNATDEMDIEEDNVSLRKKKSSAANSGRSKRSRA